MSAVVVNHNDGEQIMHCLRHLQALRPSLEQVIVIDSGSTAGSPDAIRQTFPATRVIELESNLSPSVARNSRAPGGEDGVCPVVDDDVYLAPDCTRLLIERVLATGCRGRAPRALSS